MKVLADDPSKVIARHDEITAEHGPYIANGSMRTLRAVYNHARKAHRYLPTDNPASAVYWNSEQRRSTAMGLNDLPQWFQQVAALPNPIRREFHMFSLLSGSRPTAALMEAKPHHLDLRRRVLHIPRPKGGADRAFDVPLLRQMVLCLLRLMRLVGISIRVRPRNGCSQQRVTVDISPSRRRHGAFWRSGVTIYVRPSGRSFHQLEYPSLTPAC
ncbi:hypothetical protein [Ancylobacter sp. WKF20]|uniref:hypothetical protein n=1 Tax=Ancylobacter sp. WKF20 TaxID=3039801 RepID=UPI00325FC28E